MRESLRPVGLVARREFAAQVRTKSFLISNIVMLVLIVGGLVAFSALRGDGSPDKVTVALAGPESSLSAIVEASGAAAGLDLEVRAADNEG